MIISGIWIIISDKILFLFVKEVSILTSLQIVKGWVFIIFTTLLLIKLIHSDNKKNNKIEEILQEREKQLLTLINTIPDFVIFKDGEGRWLQANKVALRLFELDDDTYRTKSDIELANISNLYRELHYCNETDEIAWNSKTNICIEEMIIKSNGEPKIFEVIKVPSFHSNGSRKGLVVIGRDITDRKKGEETIQYLAYHDPLTELPNRRLFKERLIQTLDKAKNEKLNLSIIFIDIDHFKNINDTLGHAIGDSILKIVAKNLKSCFQQDEVVARIGGDEFTVLIPKISGIEDIKIIATKILNTFKHPIKVKDHDLFISLSIGISLYPYHGYDTETLIKHADTAMYYAKHQGKNQFQIYNKEIDAYPIQKIEQ